MVVPDFWESATGVLDELVKLLKNNHDHELLAELRSTGDSSSDDITLDDDIQAVRSYIEPLVMGGHEVIISAQSADG